MSADIALVWSNANLRADIAMAGPDIALDAGLQTAITISLLTDLGSWWGDPTLGSKLYLLKQSTLTQDTLNAAQDYAVQALQWLLDDGVAGAVNVVATATSLNTMKLAVTITQAGNAKTYDVVWRGQAAA